MLPARYDDDDDIYKVIACFSNFEIPMLCLRYIYIYMNIIYPFCIFMYMAKVHADDKAILVNTPVQAETLLHSLERAAAGIGLQINAHKSENMSFNQTGDISIRSGSSLNLVDKFTYLGSSVSSTEKTSIRG